MILKSAKEAKIYNYIFNEFTENDKKREEISQFKFSKIVQADFNDQHYQQMIRDERTMAEDMGFIISPLVKEYRGIKHQELTEYKKNVALEVETKVLEIKNQWERKGFEEGRKQALEEIDKTIKQDLNQQVEIVKNMIQELTQVKVDIVKKQKDELLEFIRILVKWILLKEINQDKEYLARLLEKLVHELGSKENLVVKINKADYALMPEVIQSIHEKFTEIKNIRLEIDHEQRGRGIILESPNGIIDGSLEGQMDNLDKIFESVVKNEK